MRRTHLTILQLLTITSTALFLAAAGLWPRSYFSTDACGGTAFRSQFSATSSRGRASLTWASSAPPGFSFYHSSMYPAYVLRTYGPLGRLGFFLDHGSSTPGYSRLAIVFPIWPILLITALLPAWCWLIRRRPPIQQACPVCGYDLRATPHRCPECGTKPASIPNAQTPPK